MNKFLIIGTGGVGGSIAGFLALAGKDVTCIARGKHLEAIREKGLHLKSDLKGEPRLRSDRCLPFPVLPRQSSAIPPSSQSGILSA